MDAIPPLHVYYALEGTQEFQLMTSKMAEFNRLGIRSIEDLIKPISPDHGQCAFKIVREMKPVQKKVCKRLNITMIQFYTVIFYVYEELMFAWEMLK